ncbi:agarase [Wenyingzhuangia heitensis]|uniref:Agarase n=1 Tax=Wenyingzhuangia heitensis TaxID=1487859 RepID=A0ABX0U924_9FLAO|nr:agarase [Wenyingzhuangia heitensis]NIJ44859.1 agarase [Wenyingzhuangia heitensis]
MNYKLQFVFFFSLYFLGSPSNAQIKSVWNTQKQISLFGFENKKELKSIKGFDIAFELTQDKGVTKGTKALKLVFAEDEKSSGIDLKSKTGWDATSLGDYCLVFDATNLTDIALHLNVSVHGKGGWVSRFANVPAGVTKTYFFEVKGEYLGKDHGLRDDPSPFKTNATRMIVKGRKSGRGFSKISQIKFYVTAAAKEKTLVIDNVRLVKSPKKDPNYLTAIVDKYGQNNKVDFNLKIKSDEQLKALAEKELRALAISQPMADRSKFGGWKNGPQLKGTGYFRTEKVSGKWALVDPEGYLFYSTGIANARMANTTTFTGMDFKDDSVRYKDPEDVTPEDSKGMVALSKEVTKTAFKAYPWRNNMFVGLPKYDDPLANHYSYRRESHMGPIEHGETYSFYQANLERRYGEQYPGSYLLKWRDVTLDRMLDWGFTSFGNWAAEDFYGSKRMPYYANGWIIGEYKTLSKGYWGAMPDPYDPEFVRRAKQSIGVVADQVKGNPWCVGVFIDNEKSWGREGSPDQRYIIVIDALKKDAKESPTKAEIIKYLKKKYTSVKQISRAWKKKIDSWETLEKGIAVDKSKKYTSKLQEDLAQMTIIYASEYFRVVHNALEEKMPNHLYMGVRFTTWGMTPEVREAAKKYIDVFSVNFYRETLGKNSWNFLAKLDKPSIIGEFHFGATDTGFFHPGIVYAADQKDRGRMWKKYNEDVLENPYFVGAHWFQYIDSPITGRAHDGENYNVGFVTNTDVPYPDMVKAAKEFHRTMYQKRYGSIKK